MKMDLDLIRELLLFIEKNEKLGDVLVLADFDIPNYTKEHIFHHLVLLDDTDYIVFEDTRCMGAPLDCEVERLTIQGHQYLGNIRDETIWKKTKEKLKEVPGVVALKIVYDVASFVAKEALCLNS